MHVIEDQPCNDCFVEIDCSDRLMESEYCRNPNPSVYGSYDFPKQTSSPQHYQTPKDRKEDSATLFSPLTEKIIFKSKPPFFKLCQEHEGNGDFIQSKIMTLKKENSQFSPSKLARLTPITVDSKASITDTTKNGETFSSLNTLHRRTNLFSLGFFTTETLDVINSSTSDINCGTCTPRTHQDNDSNVFKFDDIHRHRFLAYETPDEPRAVDYGSFRKAIKEVTCQKKTAIDDVSPIGSEDGFSACFNGSGAIGVSTTPRLSIAKASDHKSQHCDVASVLRQVNQVDLLNGTKGESNPNVIPGLNLFGEFRAEESNRDSGSNKYLVPKFEKGKTKSEQSFIHGTSEGEAAHAQITDTSDEKENGLKKRSSLTNASPAAASGRQKGSSSPNCNRAQSKQDEFLRKSSSFLKVLRKTGRKGKCLIQGWVAFRQSVPWDEIARNPKRCDFRYIVLLDDKPILHIFTSRSKTKKGLPNQQQQEEELLSPDELDGCISLDLTEDIAMEMKFVSKELGNAMCIRDTETGQLLCNMLPISMPSNAFLDKHQSRLVKRDKLRCIFSRTTSQQAKQSQQDKSSNAKQDKDMLSPLSKSSKWGDPGFIDRLYTPIEQYDVSRHLLFVLDAAIKFPPPRS